MKDVNIAFIGGGNMARSLIGGLIADGYDRARLCAADPDPEQRAHLAREFGIQVLDSNATAAAGATVIVIAVKPQIVGRASADIRDAVTTGNRLIISIAAGLRTSTLAHWLGERLAIVRAMPNTPALVQSSATALYATPTVSADQRSLAESILRAVGLTLWLDDERQMDAVTAVSGSGPAYFFLVMEAMERAAHELGLPEDTARLLTLQTAFGAAKMALESATDPATLRRQVTSPGGTTERAIGVLQGAHLDKIFSEALKAACDRAAELATLLGDDARR
jgi:pyrroline-5-carboxylate reductase